MRLGRLFGRSEQNVPENIVVPEILSPGIVAGHDERLLLLRKLAKNDLGKPSSSEERYGEIFHRADLESTSETTYIHKVEDEQDRR